MSVTLFERYASRESTTGANAQVRLMYVVGFTEDEREVRLKVLAESPLDFEGVLIRQSTRQEHQGAGLWYASVDYGIPHYSDTGRDPRLGGTGQPDSNDDRGTDDKTLFPFESTVDFSGTTVHIEHSLHTTATYAKNGDHRPIIDHKGTIGVSEHGNAGCDIHTPSMTFQEVWLFNFRFVDYGYIKKCRNLIGRVNKSKFRSFEPGEVLFLGGTVGTVEQIETGKAKNKATFFSRKMTFKFKVEKNLTNFIFSKDFSPINKKGHEYLWIEYEDIPYPPPPARATGKQRIPKVIRVEEVGPDSDVTLNNAGFFPTNEREFSDLGIGS